MSTASYISGDNLFCIQSPGCEFEDIKSRIVCQEIRILPCGGAGNEGDCGDTVVNNGFILCDCDDSYNCNLCGNDLPYYHLLNPGDPIYVQFQQVDIINGQSGGLGPGGVWGEGKGWGSGMMEGFIRDCCTGEKIGKTFSDLTANVFVGVYESIGYDGSLTFTNIQQGWINSSLICAELSKEFPSGGGCFYLTFEFYDEEGEIINEFCSEPYKCNPCPDGNTVQLEGLYPAKDCFGLFYGTPGVGIGIPFPYRNVYRVPGVFEPTSYEVTKEFVGTFRRTTSSELIEGWQLSTSGVPRRVARYIANILSSPDILVEGVGYTMEGEIPKNNEVGTRWFIEAPFRSVTCAKNFTCND